MQLSNTYRHGQSGRFGRIASGPARLSAAAPQRGLPAKWLAGLLTTLTLTGAPALADDGLRLSGFGTLGYAYDRYGDIAPARDISQQPRDGASTGPGWRLDSRLGVQLEYRLGAGIDLVGQFVARDHFKADLGSATELAYAAFKPLPQLDLRAGRINYDAFLMSDHRNVGYAYPWVRPPAEFYGWIPIFSVDGADLAYTVNGDDARWRVKLQAGRARLDIPIGEGYEFKADQLRGLSLSRETATWRLKAAYSQFTVGSEVPAFAPLHRGLDAVAAAAIPGVSAEAAELRRELSFEGARISYATLGASYDDGTWLAQAEIGRTTATADVVPHGKMAYASLGRRFGNWTPFLLYGISRPANDLRSAANNWGGFNAALRDPALFVVNATRIEQDTFSVGTRWDFHRQAALKLQWDHTRIKPSGYGLWWRELPLNERSRHVSLISATLDFTF